MDGIDAEWVTEKEYLKEDVDIDKKLSATDANIPKMGHLETVMVSDCVCSESWLLTVGIVLRSCMSMEVSIIYILRTQASV